MSPNTCKGCTRTLHPSEGGTKGNRGKKTSPFGGGKGEDHAIPESVLKFPYYLTNNFCIINL